jgi:PAS domain S-box-containing protein
MQNAKRSHGSNATHVLHVDADPSVLQESKQNLKKIGGFEVDTATSVDQAIIKLKHQRYDAVISEYELPQKSGLELLKQLDEQLNRPPFIIFTNKSSEETAVKALNMGANGYINKQGGSQAVYSELAQRITALVSKYRAEMKIKQNDALLRSVYEHSFDAIIVGAADESILSANQAACKLFGLSENEIQSVPRSSLIVVDKKAKNTFREVAEKGRASAELTFKHTDGSTFDVEVTIGAFKDADGTSKGSMIIRDITEHKKAEAALKEAKATFQSLVECTSDWIWQVDENAVYTYVSPKIQDILGYTAEEVLGKTPFDLMPKADLDETAPIFAAHVNRQEPFQTLYNWNVHKNGSLVLLESSGVPVIDSNGKTIGFRGIDRDVTKRKQTEDALIASEKRNRVIAEKLRVLGDLTRHDVRNKLSIITSTVYMIKKTYANQPDLTQKLASIEQAARASTEILEFARIYEHLGVTEPIEVDVKKAVAEASEMFTNLPFKVINDCHGLTVIADSFLRQLIYNLIDNTRKYAQKASTARVYYQKAEGGELHLIYEDNGVGIPPANKPQLFKQGFTTGGGTGLGLFLSKKMIEVYGWQITETGEPGRGVKFMVTIPQINTSNRLNYRIAL